MTLDDDDDIPRKPILMQIAAWIWIVLGFITLFMLEELARVNGDPIPYMSFSVALLVISIGSMWYGIRVLLVRSGQIALASVISILLGMNSLRVTLFIATEAYARKNLPQYIQATFAVAIATSFPLILAGVFAFISRKKYYRYREWINNPPQTN